MEIAKTPEQLAMEYVTLMLDLKTEHGEIRPIVQQMMRRIGDQLFEMDPIRFHTHVNQATDTLKMMGVRFDD